MPVPSSVSYNEVVYTTTAVGAAKATNKSNSNTNTEEYVTATITIYWKDVLGTGNEFMGLSGSWNATTNPETGKVAKLSNIYVSLRGRGVNASNFGELYSIRSSGDKFEIPDSAYADGWWSYNATSSVKINSSSNLSVTVYTG